MKAVRPVACGSLILLLAATGGATSQRINLAGATGSGPFETVKDFAAAFESKFPFVDMSLSSIGSGAAQSALWGDVDCDQKPVENVCDGVMLDSTLWGIGGGTIDEEASNEHIHQRLKQMPALGGPVLVTYSKDVTGDLGSVTSKQLNLSALVIAGIFNNSITRWDDPRIQKDNPHLELPDKPITVLVRSDKSGMSQTLTKFIKHNNPDWPEEAVGKKPEWPLKNLTHLTDSYQATGNLNFKADGQTGIGIGLLRNPYSIGYMELGQFSTLTQFVAQAHVSLASDCDFQPATVETLKVTMDGLAHELDQDTLALDLVTKAAPLGGYKISHYVYWYLKQSPSSYDSCTQAWFLFKFFEWVYTDPIAEEISVGHGWVVPPKSVVDRAMQVLTGIECIVIEEEHDGREYFAGTTILAHEFLPFQFRDTPEDSTSLLSLLTTIIPCATLVVLVFGGFVLYNQRSKRMADSVWKVKPDEMIYADPPEVLGRGTFGLVLLGTYRGTPVAVKRVLPCRAEKDVSGKDMIMDPMENFDEMESGVLNMSSGHYGLKSNTGFMASRFLGKKDSYTRLREDFVKEMRYLSKLRHPCITMVMGAVIEQGQDPMLVMEHMNHGSLYDILHNESFPLEGDMILPILRDIAQGVLFLHSADPQVIHSDLKAQNILIDSKFRAKVADFGLSAKKQVGIAGTPLWMAPELLRSESLNTAASDIYALGVILYEVYSRKVPYYEFRDLEQVLQEVASPSANRRPAVPPACPSIVRVIMKECWNSEPANRPTAAEIDTRLKRLDVEMAEPCARMKRRMSSTDVTNKEGILFDLFPKHIAEAIRDGRKVEPERRDNVTIFFASVHDFEDIVTSSSPEKISDLLDRLYDRFDQLTAKHDVFKIETVGDSYMCASNLVKIQDKDHAKRIAQFSIEAIRAASETPIDVDDPSMGNVKIRVGFHSGAVISNLVGTCRPKFGVFGDTVNTANKIKDASKPGRIRCSDFSAGLLKVQNPEITIFSRMDLYPEGLGVGDININWVWIDGDGHLDSKSKKSSRVKCAGRESSRMSLADALASTTSPSKLASPRPRRSYSGVEPTLSHARLDGVIPVRALTDTEYWEHNSPTLDLAARLAATAGCTDRRGI